MGIRIYLFTLLWIGWIAYTQNRSVLPLALTQVQSGDDVTLVCTAINTTINMSFTTWYRDEVRVMVSLTVNSNCYKHQPNNTKNNHVYRFDLYTSADVSISCSPVQHNLTLTTTEYVKSGTVWRCEDQRLRSSNNLTSGTIYESASTLTDPAKSVTSVHNTHDMNTDFSGSASESTSPLTDSPTTLGTSTSRKTTPDTDSDDQVQDGIMYISAGAGGGAVILTVVVICTCVCCVRRRRKREAKQTVNDADIGAELSETTTTATNQYEPLNRMGNLTNVYALVHKPLEGEPVHSAVETADGVDEAHTVQLDGDGAVNVGDVYAVPDKTRKHQPAVGSAVNADDLYAVPDKTRKHQPAVGSAVNADDLYAVPDKTRKHQHAVDSVGNVDDLYAVTDKSKETRKETYSIEINSEYSEI